jgi:hypothetical protein
LQWPSTHGPRADQPYFFRANQPEGREVKGGITIQYFFLTEEMNIARIDSRRYSTVSPREEKGLEARHVPNIESLVDAVDRVRYIVILLLHSWSTHQMTAGQLLA